MIVLTGSERAPLAAAADAGPADQAERVELTVMLRRKAPGVIGADADDIALAQNVLKRMGLSVTTVHNASRRVKVAGTLGGLSAAFGTSVRLVRSPSGLTHRYRTGALYLPDEMAGIVIAVLGLDNRPQARPYYQVARADSAPAATPTYTSADLAAIYGFPGGTTGAGQTIALVELGGGYTDADLSSYCSGLGIAVPTVTAVPVDGATNNPGAGGADVEVALDIDVACGAAPGPPRSCISRRIPIRDSSTR